MREIKWFIDRVGKRIYRDKGTCKCFTCKDTEKNGLIIIDESHASYLHMCQEMHNYRDNLLNNQKENEQK